MDSVWSWKEDGSVTRVNEQPVPRQLLKEVLLLTGWEPGVLGETRRGLPPHPALRSLPQKQY